MKVPFCLSHRILLLVSLSVHQGTNQLSNLYVLQTGVMLLYSFPALSSGYSKTFKPYIFPYILPLTQVRQFQAKVPEDYAKFYNQGEGPY